MRITAFKLPLVIGKGACKLWLTGQQLHKETHALIPGTYEFVNLCSKRDLTDKIKDFEREGLS